MLLMPLIQLILMLKINLWMQCRVTQNQVQGPAVQNQAQGPANNNAQVGQNVPVQPP